MSWIRDQLVGIGISVGVAMVARRMNKTKEPQMAKELVNHKIMDGVELVGTLNGEDVEVKVKANMPKLVAAAIPGDSEPEKIAVALLSQVMKAIGS